MNLEKHEDKTEQTDTEHTDVTDTHELSPEILQNRRWQNPKQMSLAIRL